MGSFPQVSPLEPCAHLSPPPYAPHAPPISFFSILPPAQYLVRSKDTLEIMTKVGRVQQHSTKGWTVSVHDDAAKMSRVNCKWCEGKSC